MKIDQSDRPFKIAIFFWASSFREMNRDKTLPTMFHVRPAKTQIIMRMLIKVFTVGMKMHWLLGYYLLTGCPSKTDQTSRMRRLIWVFARRTCKRIGKAVPRLKLYGIWASAWQNLKNGMCAQWRLRSAWASAQSDQSLRCSYEESLSP